MAEHESPNPFVLICDDCGAFVKINKSILDSLHDCQHGKKDYTQIRDAILELDGDDKQKLLRWLKQQLLDRDDN